MKRLATVISLASFLCLTADAVFAAEKEVPSPTASAPVAFEITIADLHRAAESGDDRAIPGDRSLIVDAQIGAATIQVDTDDQFTAEVELVGGMWHGEEEVELYRAYALFDGVRFREFFSRRSATRLLPGDRILVLCRYLGIGMDYDETTPVSVVESFDLRRSQ